MKRKEKTNINIVKKELWRITGIFPLRSTNNLKDKEIRKDVIFPLLSEKVFDHPRLLNILLKKIKKWLYLNRGELTYCLAGYLYYIKEDFRRAKYYLLKAIAKNPQNLDNWFDLAFSLYHLGKADQKLAKGILFNFPLFIKFYTNTENGKQKISINSFKKCLLFELHFIKSKTHKTTRKIY